MTYVDSSGFATDVPASRSFELRGGANQALPFNMRARANVNYFSSIQTSETFNTNIYDASRNRVGTWCSMAVCGNRHNVRAFRARRSAAV